MKRVVAMLVSALVVMFPRACEPQVTRAPATSSTVAVSTSMVPVSTWVAAPTTPPTTPPPATSSVPTVVPTSAVPVVAPSTTVLVVVGLLPAPRYSIYPSWRITADGVPYYAGRPACTPEQAMVIAAQFRALGASISTQQWAVYVASRESGCRYWAVNMNRSTRDASHCAFQLNAIKGGPLHATGYLGKLGWTPAKVTAGLAECAAAAADLWALCGKGPWTKPYGCRRPTS